MLYVNSCSGAMLPWHKYGINHTLCFRVDRWIIVLTCRTISYLMCLFQQRGLEV